MPTKLELRAEKADSIARVFFKNLILSSVRSKFIGSGFHRV
jgi:hypothetical protein